MLRLVAPSLPVDCLYVFFQFFSVAPGGVVCQVFVSRLLVLQEPCERRLLVYSVVFSTDPPPGGPREGCNLCDRVWVYAESVFTDAQDAPLERGERPVRVTGRPFCLSYHLKGVCNSNCGVFHAHRPLSPHERGILSA